MILSPLKQTSLLPNNFLLWILQQLPIKVHTFVEVWYSDTDLFPCVNN